MQIVHDISESCVRCDFKHAAHYQFHSDIEALGYPSGRASLASFPMACDVTFIAAGCARFVSKHRDKVSRYNGNGIFYNNHTVFTITVEITAWTVC